MVRHVGGFGVTSGSRASIYTPYGTMPCDYYSFSNECGLTFGNLAGYAPYRRSSTFQTLSAVVVFLRQPQAFVRCGIICTVLT